MGITAYGYDLSFRSIDTSDGLPHNSVFCISQDNYGFMWFGTRFGLSRFDGTSFKVWDNSNSGLNNNSVRDLCVASDSLMFVATEKGIHRLNILNGKLSLLPIRGVDAYPRAIKLAMDADNTLWVASEDQGVFRYTDGNCRHYSEMSSATSVICSGDFLFACSPDDGLFKYDKQSGVFARILDSSYAPLSLYGLEKGILLVGTQGSGLVEVAFGKNGSYSVKTISAGPERNSNIVRSILTQGEDVYLATEGGLVIYHRQTEQIEHHTFDPKKASSIADNALYSLCFDNENGLWIGSYFRGLSYLPTLPERFESYPGDSKDTYLCGYAVSSFFELSKGEILIASEDAGISYFDSLTGTFRSFKDQSKLSYNNIHDICRDAQGRLWIGTYLHGINIYNPSTHKVEDVINEASGAIHSGSVYRLYPDRDGKIHIGTTRGVSIYDPSDGSVVKQEITHSAIIRDIFQDSEGNIWYASMNRGLFRYTPQNGRWSEYSVRNGSIPTDKTVCVRESEDGTVWIGTEGAGLISYDYATNSFRTDVAGVSSGCRFIFSIETYGNLLWMGTTTGFYRLDTKSGEMRRYDDSDGILAPYFNYNASRKMDSGDVYFGTVKGFFKFSPAAIKDNPSSPKTYITSLTVKDRSRDVAYHTEDISELNGKISPLVLSYDNNSIEFSFSSLSFSQPDKNEFRYYLEGFERGYCEPGTERRKEYNNLSPGSYTFHLISSNEDGIWSETPAEFHLQVRRPWWLSFWAIVLYALLLAFTSWLIYRRLKLRRELEMEKKIQSLNESKINFFTNITHEIKTPLTLLRSPLELIRKEGNVPDGISDKLNVIERNLDWLSRLVDELLKFRQLESKDYQLKVSHFDIREELERILSQFKSFSEANGIRLAFIDNLREPLEVDLDKYALTKIISNLLLNAFKYTKDQVALVLRHHSGDESFNIYIMDNGSGVDESEIEEIFKPFVQLDSSKKYRGVGIGLALVKSLVDLHKGKLDIISRKGKYFVAKIELPVRSDLPVSEIDTVHMDREIARECESILAVESAQLHLRRFGEAFAGRGNLLVVEDNVEIARVLIDYFKDKYCIGYSHNGADALLYISHHHPDIVITDIMMDGMDGIELCSRIKGDEATAHTLVVMLTAKTDVTDREVGLDAGADAYICKPFSFSELDKVVENMLSQKRRVMDWVEKVKNEVELPLVAGVELTDNDREFLTSMTTILRENIDNSAFSLGELALKMGKSRTLVYTKAMKLIGKSPVECLLTLRMETARRKIENGDGTISQIAYSVGYSDPGYFTRAFKKYYGQTPTEFKSEQ